MSSPVQRKRGGRNSGSSESTNSETTYKSKAFQKQTIQEPPPSLLSAIFSFLLITLVLFLTASYIVTNTFTWGRELPNWRKYLPVIL